MSKRGYISRYLLIIKKLKQRPYATADDLLLYIQQQTNYLQLHDDNLQIGFSKRTLQRDLKEIRNLFGIDIEYSKLNKGYCISQNEVESMNFNRMMEAFDVFSSLQMANQVTAYMFAEIRQTLGTEHLFGLLHAIKNKQQIKVTYEKFWEDHCCDYTLCPIALKEFKYRWYLLAKKENEDVIKSFALDRILNLTITNKQFIISQKINVALLYKNSFGIINELGKEPEHIILSFDKYQGKYIKTLPLHHSQQILIDNEEELRIGLYLKPSQDFIMELLSFGDTVKIVQPSTLIDTIKQIHQHAYQQY